MTLALQLQNLNNFFNFDFQTPKPEYQTLIKSENIIVGVLTSRASEHEALTPINIFTNKEEHKNSFTINPINILK